MKTVMIIFTAVWCKPCKDLKQIIESSKDIKDKYSIRYIDIEKYPKTKESYNVEAIPTVIVGDKRHVGTDGFEEWCDELSD